METAELEFDADPEMFFLTRKEIVRDYPMTKREFFIGKQKGYIKNIKAPNYSRFISHYRVSIAELERYMQRIESFRSSYYSYERTGEFLQWSYGRNHVNASINMKVRSCTYSNYMSVAIPEKYAFIHNRRKYFHAADLRLMRDFIIGISRGQVTKSPEYGYNGNEDVWHPDYETPLDEVYLSQYTEETTRRVSSWHDQRRLFGRRLRPPPSDHPRPLSPASPCPSSVPAQ